MKPINHLRFFRATPSALPPVGQVDFKFDPATGAFSQVNSDGTSSAIGSGGGSAETTIETVEGTSYTLSSADSGKVLKFTSGSAINLTVPATLAAEFNVGIIQRGAGVITFDTDGATNINGDVANFVTNGAYSVASLLALAAGDVVLKGDVTSLA